MVKSSSSMVMRNPGKRAAYPSLKAVVSSTLNIPISLFASRLVPSHGHDMGVAKKRAQLRLRLDYAI